MKPPDGKIKPVVKKRIGLSFWDTPLGGGVAAGEVLYAIPVKTREDGAFLASKLGWSAFRVEIIDEITGKPVPPPAPAPKPVAPPAPKPAPAVEPVVAAVKTAAPKPAAPKR